MTKEIQEKYEQVMLTINDFRKTICQLEDKYKQITKVMTDFEAAMQQVKELINWEGDND